MRPTCYICGKKLKSGKANIYHNFVAPGETHGCYWYCRPCWNDLATDCNEVIGVKQQQQIEYSKQWRCMGKEEVVA